MGFMNFLKKKSTETSPPVSKGMELPPLPASQTPSEDQMPSMPQFPEIPIGTNIVEPGAPTSDLPAIKIEEPAHTAPEPIAVGPHPLGDTEQPSAPATEPVQQAPAPVVQELPPMPDAPAMPQLPQIEEVAPLSAPEVPVNTPMDDLPAPAFEQEAMPDELHAVMPDLSAVPNEIPPLEGFPPVYRREARGPVFVRLDQFKNVVSGIEDIRTTFTSEDDAFIRIEDVKNAEQKHFDRFKNSLEDIQRKLMYVDKMLFEA